MRITGQSSITAIRTTLYLFYFIASIYYLNLMFYAPKRLSIFLSELSQLPYHNSLLKMFVTNIIPELERIDTENKYLVMNYFWRMYFKVSKS